MIADDGLVPIFTMAWAGPRLKSMQNTTILNSGKWRTETCGEAPVPLNVELAKFDRIQILLEIHIAVLSRIVGLS